MRNKLVILFVLSISVLFGQEYKFNVFGQEEGLPQPYVYDLVQAKNGFLYIATGDGLASYDGSKIKKYTIKKDGLAENYCSALMLDSKQRLWVGHFEGGISVMENKKFRKFATADFPLARVVSFVEDSKQNIYYASSAGGLYVIKDNKISLFTEEELPPINEMKIKDDVMYIGTQEGVLMFDLNTRSRSSKTIPGTEGKNITCLELTLRNELWIGVDGAGIEILAKERNEFKSVKTYTAELKSTQYNVKDICFKGNNEVWISFTGEGLRMIRFNSNYTIEKLNVINGRNGLKSMFVNRIFMDQEENFWFGTTGGGLFQFLSSRFELFNTNNFLPFDDIRTVAVDDSNNVYACSDKQFFAFNANGRLNILTNLIPDGVEEEIRTTYLNKLTGELWIGTTKNLNIFNVANNKVVFKNQHPAFKEKTINAITKDQKGLFLISTTEGLFYLNDKYEVTKSLTTNERAPHNNFLGVLSDRKDRLWVFSPETPLYSIYNDEIELEKDLDSSTSFRFNAGVQDKDENIWFATEGDGIYSYKNNRKPRYKHFTTEDGLSSDFIYGIIVSNKGDVIATHKNGISIKYANLKTFRSINKATGLPANNVNTNALFKDKKGNIWMGTTEGIIKYSPIEDRININPPVFSFLNISLNNTSLSVGDSIYKFKYNNYEVVIDFVGLSLTNPGGVSYRYMLEGFEDKFRTTAERSVTYPRLADGNYKFIIYAKNSDGFETPVPAEFKIIIGKPFWKEIWFIASSVAFVILVFYFIFKARTKKLQQAKIELEGLVMEKTAELILEKEKIEKTNELLNEKNQDITASIAYAKRIQNAVLPDKDYIKQNLDLFVLYKPRDIVSGDFYWYTESEKYSYVAVVDCTGHGVPGAFMSLLGSTFLDQVLIENRDATPSKILNELDMKLHSAFTKREEENRIGDGMDAIVMRVDKVTNEVMFSGANRPLYYYSKEGPQDFKATIYSIGGAFPNEVKGFVDMTLKVEKGDCAYMFSDGFGDQFGGEKNKRYSTKRMRAFMEELSKYEIAEQYDRIDKEFMDWMGEYEQMDDICVIGIRF
jgi:ligand-binding sensor domain-containing protein/serine phosphatase RsbU (regulator of sigma subunit)